MQVKDPAKVYILAAKQLEEYGQPGPNQLLKPGNIAAHHPQFLPV